MSRDRLKRLLFNSDTRTIKTVELRTVARICRSIVAQSNEPCSASMATQSKPASTAIAVMVGDGSVLHRPNTGLSACNFRRNSCSASVFNLESPLPNTRPVGWLPPRMVGSRRVRRCYPKAERCRMSDNIACDEPHLTGLETNCQGQKQSGILRTHKTHGWRHESRRGIKVHGTPVKDQRSCASLQLFALRIRFYFCPKREPHICDPISFRLLCVTTRPLSTMVWGTFLPSLRSAMACTEATPSRGRS